MFELKLSTANAAFDDPYNECARILRAVARAVDEGRENGPCHDSNGNTVGSWALTKA
jgi:hypothetical protein